MPQKRARDAALRKEAVEHDGSSIPMIVKVEEMEADLCSGSCARSAAGPSGCDIPPR